MEKHRRHRVSHVIKINITCNGTDRLHVTKKDKSLPCYGHGEKRTRERPWNSDQGRLKRNKNKIQNINLDWILYYKTPVGHWQNMNEFRDEVIKMKLKSQFILVFKKKS